MKQHYCDFVFLLPAPNIEIINIKIPGGQQWTGTSIAQWAANDWPIGNNSGPGYVFTPKWQTKKIQFYLQIKINHYINESFQVYIFTMHFQFTRLNKLKKISLTIFYR